MTKNVEWIMPQPDDEKYEFVRSLPKEVTIGIISDHLSRWLTYSKQDMESIINAAYTEYASLKQEWSIDNIFGRTSFGPDVKKQTVSNIFASKGGWNKNSFKTLLIKHLIAKMLSSSKEGDRLYDMNQWIHEKLKDKKNDWWSTVAADIAKKSGLQKEKTAPRSPSLSPRRHRVQTLL